MSTNKKKWEVQKRKPIRDVPTDKDFSGEASPYWDFMAEHQDALANNGKVQEDPLANPDVFSEEHSLYNRPISEEGEVRLQAIHETMPELSASQRKVLHLCADLGYTMERAAEEMRVTVATVQTLLTRARRKVMRRYDKLKTAGL